MGSVLRTGLCKTATARRKSRSGGIGGGFMKK